MHEMHEWDLKGLSKIEGHATLKIVVENKRVKSMKLRVMENRRFFTQASVGMSPAAIPSLVSRVCGTCSTAHLLCATEAIEKSFNVDVPDELLLLRKLAMNGAILRDHAMHLYIFCLPDIWNKDSIMEIADERPEAVAACFETKAAANALSSFVLGRAVHPAHSSIGGIISAPDMGKKKEVIGKLEHCRAAVLDGMKIFSQVKDVERRKTNFVALENDDFSFIEGEVVDTEGLRIPEEKFHNHLHEVVRPYSQAEAFKFDGKEYMVGALARINLNSSRLHKNTKQDAREYLKRFPSENSFDNILAQAIENLHCVDYSLELLESVDAETFAKCKPPQISLGKGTVRGVGVIEAPRGTLYHGYEIKDGKVQKADIVIPTDQNLIKLENDLKNMVNRMLKENAGKEAIWNACEKLIRAFDPCMSCASHFLRVKWK